MQQGQCVSNITKRLHPWFPNRFLLGSACKRGVDAKGRNMILRAPGNKNHLYLTEQAMKIQFSSGEIRNHDDRTD